jgi:ERO1-like protein alpha
MRASKSATALGALLAPPLLLFLLFARGFASAGVPADASSAVSFLLGALPEPVKCAALDEICEAGQLRGRVEGCLCEAEDADAENKKLLPLLHNLTRLAYFRYFKVGLDDACPLAGWPQPTCAVEACHVDDAECPAAEPVCAADGSVVSDGFAAAAALGNLNLDTPAPGRTAGLTEWEDPDESWSAALSVAAGESHYVDLVTNPEGYTGYGVLDPSDTTAKRLWALLSEQACFSEAPAGAGAGAGAPVCLEQVVLQRLVSGLHASVSTHIALTAGDASRRFSFGAPNASMYVARVGRHRERLEALYFTFLFVARAVARAGPSLAAEVARQGSGVPAEDASARELLAVLQVAVGGNLGAAFDERPLFAPASEAVARTALPPITLPAYREAFKNISALLNCVGCHKCKLWGKLQFLGVGAAAKVLLHDAEVRRAAAAGRASGEGEALRVTRNEVVALVNVFHRLAISIDAVPRMRELEAREKAGAGQLPPERLKSAIEKAFEEAVVAPEAPAEPGPHAPHAPPPSPPPPPLPPPPPPPLPPPPSPSPLPPSSPPRTDTALLLALAVAAVWAALACATLSPAQAEKGGR